MFSLRDLPELASLKKDAERIPTLDPEAVVAFLGILAVASDVERRLDAHFGRWGISQARFTALRVLDRRGGAASPAAIAEAMDVTRATITGLLDGLERDGLVVRTPRDDDRRMVDVALTRKAKSLLARVLPEHYARIGELMQDLTHAEKRQLADALSRVRARVRAE